MTGIPGFDLTGREPIVPGLMTGGLNNTRIVARSTVSPANFKSHVSNILSGLGVAGLTEGVTQILNNHISFLPQVAEANTPRRVDAAGVGMLYSEYRIRVIHK